MQEGPRSRYRMHVHVERRGREHVAIPLGGSNFILRLARTNVSIYRGGGETSLGSALRVHGNFLTSLAGAYDGKA